MSSLSSFLLPVGFFVAVIGAFLVSKSPILREELEQSEFLRAHRRAVGAALVVLGLAVMWLSIATHG